MLLQNYKTCTLSHSNYFFLRGEDDNVFLAASRNGDLTLFDHNGCIIKEIKLNTEINSVDFFHHREMIAFTSKKGLFIVDYQLKTLFSSNEEYLEIKFQNGLLWAVKKKSSELVSIELYDLEKWAIIATKDIVDIYNESGYFLGNGSDKNSVVLWMAAGQDGQCSFFLNLINEEIISILFSEKDTIPFVFYPTGKQYLVSRADEELLIYNFPENQLISKFQYPEEIIPIDSISYVNEHKILLCTRNGILYLLNALSLSLEEIIIKGHEPKPCYYYYPTLKDEDLVTNISFIQRFDNYILIPFNSEKTSSIIIIESSEFNRNSTPTFYIQHDPNQLKFDF